MLRKKLLRLGALGFLGYLILIGLITGCQSSLIYFPAKDTEAASLLRARTVGLEPWRNNLGKLIGWGQPNPAASARLLVFCGNAGSALDRIGLVQAFGSMNQGRNWEVWIVEYPGYGGRPGTPGKAAFFAAGREAQEALARADRRPIYLLGESLGSGTASALAGEAPADIAGLLLIVPFARMAEVAKEKFPFLPVGLILRDKFDNIGSLQGYTGPVVFVLAGQDEVVGVAQGRKLAESYRGPQLRIEIPEAGHNGVFPSATADWVVRSSDYLLRRGSP